MTTLSGMVTGIRSTEPEYATESREITLQFFREYPPENAEAFDNLKRSLKIGKCTFTLRPEE
jgi:hypothetical protein